MYCNREGMKPMLSQEEKQHFLDVLKQLRREDGSRLLELKKYMQHGKTSVYRHSINVAYESYKAAKKLTKIGIQMDETELIRGALLHDYFLYDWHVKSPNRPLHGFFHPGRALKNAERDFKLTDKERDIIRKHMFPMTLYVPRYKETVLVCLMDKWVATLETVRRS